MTARIGLLNLRCIWLVALVSLATSLLALTQPPRAAGQQPGSTATLERALAEHAVKLLAICKERGYQNVGVLKFRVQKGQEKLSDNVGPLNMALAEKLQKALVLKNDGKVGIIRDASKVAANTKGANHLRAGEGRAKLFESVYPLAWGNQKVKADAFIFGTAKLEPSLTEMTVALFAIDTSHVGTDKKCEHLAQFKSRTDANLLVDAGESFALRGAFDDIANNRPTTPLKADAHLAKIANDAASIHKRADKYPLDLHNCPVGLEIYYGGRPVPYTLDDGGRALISPPHEGVPVYFKIKRNAPGRYGITLKVNGINTVFEERMPAEQCTKWILEPHHREIIVPGYYRPNGTYAEFRVGSLQESRAQEMNFGADVGQISFTVYRELNGGDSFALPPPPPPLMGDDAADEDAIRAAAFPTDAQNLSALKQKLADGATRTVTRNLILTGDVKEGHVDRVAFTPDPNPLLNAVITYYQKIAP